MIDPTSIPFPAFEVPRHVIDHLVRLEIGVVVRNRNGLGVPLELAGAERADHEAGSLEGLMSRRRLMEPARLRLEVGDVERPGIDEAIPADDVERVIVEDIGLVASPHPDRHPILTRLIMSLQLHRAMHITVVVGSMLEKVAVFVPISPGRLDLSGADEYQQPMLTFADEAISAAPRDDDVIALAIGQVAEDRLDAPDPSWTNRTSSPSPFR